MTTKIIVGFSGCEYEYGIVRPDGADLFVQGDLNAVESAKNDYINDIVQPGIERYEFPQLLPDSVLNECYISHGHNAFEEAIPDTKKAKGDALKKADLLELFHLLGMG
uniref:Uncharacterized protein n=1 Tax=Cacopsylla melanoneura TaxID=428564 RepID=A0A8D9BZU1_9HEMI